LTGKSSKHTQPTIQPCRKHGLHTTRDDASSCAQERLRGKTPQSGSILREQSTDCQNQVAVEDRPYPKIQKPTDAVLKVSSTALCGSDLHFYRGHLKCPPDFICGHEFVGEIVEKGDEVSKFNIGDKVRNTGEIHGEEELEFESKA
jgi:hypothetical protein